jgi:hypothetical protein
MSRRAKWTLTIVVALCASSALAWLLWQPSPRSSQKFDRGLNGLWVGHQWYTGKRVRTGAILGPAERQALVSLLKRRGLKWVFVHAGPINEDGTITDAPSPFAATLRRDTPQIEWIPWIGGDVRKLRLHDSTWRKQLVETVSKLKDAGYRGVHLDLEPVADEQPGYLALFDELRARLGREFLLSHATHRAGPFGVAAGPMGKWFWSEAFYKATMARTDQTVLMAYDTTINVKKSYIGFVRHQTSLLLDWACAASPHRVLIGIPSYEDVPRLSNPKVENIENAALGVRAALEEKPARLDCFEGVAVYAEWVTSEDEWQAYEKNWAR